MSSHEPTPPRRAAACAGCCAASCRTWRRGGPRATPSRADLRPGHQLRRLLHLRRGAAADHEAHQLAAGGRPGRDCCPNEGLRGDLAVPQHPHISDNCEFLSGEPSPGGDPNPPRGHPRPRPPESVSTRQSVATAGSCGSAPGSSYRPAGRRPRPVSPRCPVLRL